jgi:hypothetical protein
VNIFLVILNAEMRFQHYFKSIRDHQPLIPLPSDILNLMHRTVELVELIYWKPFPEKGTKGHDILAQNRKWAAKDLGDSDSDTSNNCNIDMDDSGDIRTRARLHAQLERVYGADTKTRKAYFSSMMCSNRMFLFLSIVY